MRNRIAFCNKLFVWKKNFFSCRLATYDWRRYLSVVLYGFEVLYFERFFLGDHMHTYAAPSRRICRFLDDRNSRIQPPAFLFAEITLCSFRPAISPPRSKMMMTYCHQVEQKGWNGIGPMENTKTWKPSLLFLPSCNLVVLTQTSPSLQFSLTINTHS